MKINTWDIITINGSKHEVRPTRYDWYIYLMDIESERASQEYSQDKWYYTMTIDKWKPDRLKQAIIDEWIDDEIDKYLWVQDRIDEITWEVQEMEYRSPEEQIEF